jgi:uncharacterized protein (DUF924 family)
MQKTLLNFWFGSLTGPETFNRDRYDLWFKNGRAYDETIREHFGNLWRQAEAGDLDDWAETPQGRLALILLLDQAPRHIHRGTTAAFAQDYRAQALTLAGMAQGHDRELWPIQRLFFYLPLEHAEDLALQEQSVIAFTQLRNEAPMTLKEDFEGFLDYARRHHEVIAHFGRFPDLNVILGRDSTPEELAFLKEPGSSFL